MASSELSPDLDNPSIAFLADPPLIASEDIPISQH